MRKLYPESIIIPSTPTGNVEHFASATESAPSVPSSEIIPFLRVALLADCCGQKPVRWSWRTTLWNAFDIPATAQSWGL